LILGGVSTLVSKWLAGIGLDPTLVIDEHLIDFDKKKTKPLNPNKGIMGIQEGLVINTDTAIEVKALNMAEKEILDTLKRLKSFFPYSLDGNTLLSNIFWEYSFAWKNCVADLRPLKTALNVADTIPCLHTQQSKYNILLCKIINSNITCECFIYTFRYVFFNMVYTYITYFFISCETY